MAQGPRIVAVGGARDGVGKTAFAVNSALAFLKETRKRVLVLDMDREGAGDVQTLLSMTKVKSFADFAPYADKLSSNQLRQYISAHPAGLGILPLGNSAKEAAQVSPEAAGRIIELLKPICDYVVVDCGVDIHDVTVKVFEQAAGIFLMCTPDLLVLNHTRRFVDRLQRLHFPKELIKVILNRYDAQVGPPLDLITQKLARSVLVTLLEDEQLCRNAGFAGKPFVVDQPRARLSTFKDLCIFVDPDTFGRSRDDLLTALATREIQTKKYYYPPIHQLAVAQTEFAGQSFPRTERLSSRVLALPLYAHMPFEEVDVVCDAVIECRGA